jgi:hypothetical protein
MIQYKHESAKHRVAGGQMKNAITMIFQDSRANPVSFGRRDDAGVRHETC